MAVCLMLTLWGCGHSGAHYQPIVDGPKDDTYFSDLKACQALAQEKSYLNDDVKSEAILGTAVGAVIGGLSDDWEGAAVGAVAGGLITGGGKAWETRYDRSAIVCECMRQRGHRVVEK